LQVEERVERIKQELQKGAVRSINQMQIKTALQRILELAKVKYFEEKGTIDGFDPSNIFKIDFNNDGRLDAEHIGKKVPIINKENLRLSASKLKRILIAC
jgi:hypothetical protein